MDFKNTVIILTSNLGSQYLLEGVTDTGEIREEAREAVMNELHRCFRPEFLNRLDEIICFRPLTKENLTDILTQSLRGRLAEKELKLEVTDRAKNFVIDSAYDPAYGARPLKRFLQSRVETLVARKIIADELSPGDTITIDVRDGDLVCA